MYIIIQYFFFEKHILHSATQFLVYFKIKFTKIKSTFANRIKSLSILKPNYQINFTLLFK